jgi:uncharacterized membrane protein YsdA (DUF1294 family)
MLLGWISLLSAVTFAVMARDKFQAIAGRRRIPEATLFTLALVGGSPGLVAGMLLLRHKTSKTTFIVSTGLIVGLQVLLWFWFRIG